jgi:tetratricopeptide (TPR) repeat protein
LAVAELAVGRAEEATESLRRSTDLHRNAGNENDLAAVLVDRGIAEDDPALIAEGLEILLSGGPAATTVESSFNRSLALESLGLKENAYDAWSAYLEGDPSSPWAMEARARTHRLRTSLGPRPSLIPETLEREVLEVALVSWARSITEGRHAEGENALLVAEGRADQHAAATGDPLLLEIVRAIRTAGSTSDELARAHMAYAHARASYGTQDVAACVRQTTSALDLLRNGSHRVSSLALLTRASCEFLGNQLDQARRDVGAALEIDRAHGSPSPVIGGLAHWLAGLTAHAQNSPIESLRAYRDAIAEFSRAGDPYREAALHALLAGLYDYLGRSEEAWEETVLALRLDDTAPNRRHQALWIFAELSRRMELRQVALTAAVAMQEPARRTRLHDYEADALLVLGRAQRDAGEIRHATNSFASALRTAGRITDPAARSRSTAHAAVELAHLIVRNDPDRAEELLGSVNAFDRSDGATYLAAATVRALVQRQRGSQDAAIQTLRAAARRSTAERRALRTTRERDEILARRAAVHRDLVQLLVERDHDSEALDVLEEWRTEPFASPIWKSTSIAAAASAGEDGATLIAFLPLDQELLVWHVYAGHMKLLRRPIQRSRLAVLVDEATREVLRGETRGVAARRGHVHPGAEHRARRGEVPSRAGEVRRGDQGPARSGAGAARARARRNDQVSERALPHRQPAIAVQTRE